MASLDIGIDLGTSVIIANDSSRKVILREPSVVAVDRRTDKILGIGEQVYDMIGRAPGYIDVIRPMSDGVISDYKMTEVLIRHLLRKITHNQLLKPRVALCVPSAITGVESQAAIDAAVAAGARKVFLIEEPVAAAIGAGIDLSKPEGNLIVDIGGGTTDVAVLSLNGVVCKTSIKTAGHSFDEALVRYMRKAFNLLIGERMAEEIKKDIGTVYEGSAEKIFDVKGRDLVTGLPKRVRLSRSQTLGVLREPMENIVRAVQNVLERTPPELSADIRTNGLILTGGGVLLNGLDKVLERATKVPAVLAEEPSECVAIGTAKSFRMLDSLYDGLVQPAMHAH